jgi:hypothetical protein
MRHIALAMHQISTPSLYAPRQAAGAHERYTGEPRITRSEDEEMDPSAGFMLDKGRYPWDVAE